MSFAYEGSQPGSSPGGHLERVEQAPVKSIAPREVLGEAELESRLANVEEALERGGRGQPGRRSAPDVPQRADGPQAPADPDGGD